MPSLKFTNHFPAVTRIVTCGLAAVGCVVLAGCARFEAKPLSAATTTSSLESRTLESPELKSFLQTNLHRDLTPWPQKAWDFQTLTLVAFYFHPSLDVARAQWGVAEAGVATAGGRPNPVLSAVPGYSLNPASGISPWFPSVSIDIPIETAGKRGYRIAQAQQLSDAAWLNIASVAWQVRSGVRTSLLDYAAAQQRAGLWHRQLQLQREIVTLLDQRFQAGAIGRNELTPARLALAKSESELADAIRQAAESRLRLAESLGLPARAIEGIELNSVLPTTSGSGMDLTSVEARQRALLGRSDVLAALSEYASRQSALQLEIAKQYPDVHLSPGYQFDQGEHKLSLGLSVELPVLNQNQGPIAEAKAKREESAARFVALQAKVIAEVDRALAARASAVEQAKRLEKLAQLALEQTASVEAQRKAGASDKLDLASAQLEAAASELALVDAQIKAAQVMAQLEDAMQLPLESWPALEEGRGPQAKQEKP